MLPSRPLLVLAMLGLTVACSLAQAKKEALDHPDYAKVKALLSAKCYSCHGALKQKGKLRLDTRNLMLKGEVIYLHQLVGCRQTSPKGGRAPMGIQQPLDGKRSSTQIYDVYATTA